MLQIDKMCINYFLKILIYIKIFFITYCTISEKHIKSVIYKRRMHHFQNRIHRSKALSKENSKITVPGFKTVNFNYF